jgi:hypothetical protein
MNQQLAIEHKSFGGVKKRTNGNTLNERKKGEMEKMNEK